MLGGGSDPFQALELVPFTSAGEVTCDEDLVGDPEIGALLCPSSRTVFLDEPLALRRYDEMGDFAIGYMLGTAWSEAAQESFDSPLSGEDRALINDCLTGAWAQTLVPDAQGNTQRGVLIEPGDLDEAIQTALGRRRPRHRRRRRRQPVREDRQLPHRRPRRRRRLRRAPPGLTPSTRRDGVGPRPRTRATERQRGSGHRRPAWPGNDTTGPRPRTRATERQRGSGHRRPAWPGNAVLRRARHRDEQLPPRARPPGGRRALRDADPGEGGRAPRSGRRRHEGAVAGGDRPGRRLPAPDASHRRQLRRPPAGGGDERGPRGHQRRGLPPPGPRRGRARHRGHLRDRGGPPDPPRRAAGRAGVRPPAAPRRHRRRIDRAADRRAGRRAGRPQLQARRRAPHRALLPRRRGVAEVGAGLP